MIIHFEFIYINFSGFSQKVDLFIIHCSIFTNTSNTVTNSQKETQPERACHDLLVFLSSLHFNWVIKVYMVHHRSDRCETIPYFCIHCHSSLSQFLLTDTTVKINNLIVLSLSLIYR